MAAVVGLEQGASSDRVLMYTTPFTVENSRDAAEMVTTVDWLRTVDVAVAHPDIGAMFNRATNKEERQMCYSAWLAMRADLSSATTAALLQELCTTSPDARVLLAEGAPQPTGLFTLLKFIGSGPPTQMKWAGRGYASTPEPVAGFEVRPVTGTGVVATRSEVDDMANLIKSGFVFDKLPGSGASAGLDCVEYKMGELMTLLSKLTDEYRGHQPALKPLLDCFGALIYLSFTDRFVYAVKPDVFPTQTMRTEYEASGQHPAYALWNWLLQRAGDGTQLQRSVYSLYELNKCILNRRRRLTRLQLHAQYICLFGALGNVMHLEFPCRPARPVHAHCAYLFGCTVLTHEAELLQDVQADVHFSAVNLPACRRLVIETQAVLPAIAVSRSMCCYSAVRVILPL